MIDKKLKQVESIFNVVSILILIVSIVFAIIWLLNASINIEPILAFLGLLYAIIPIFGKTIIKRLNKKVKDEELTLSYALAYGYLYNYLAPVVRRLRKNESQAEQIRFFVYIPGSLEELNPDSIDEVLTELANKDYIVRTIELSFTNEKRKKDFRTARKKNDDSKKYFDFPTTLLTLRKVIEYKLKTNSNTHIDEDVKKLAKEYILGFKTELEELLNLKEFDAIRDNIIIVSDNRFSFLDEIK